MSRKIMRAVIAALIVVAAFQAGHVAGKRAGQAEAYRAGRAACGETR